jgi:hypothetical protein
MLQKTQKTIEGVAGIDAEQAGNIVLLSIIAAFVRAVVGEKCRNCRRLISNAFLGAFVALMVHYIASYYDLESKLSKMITGIGALLARDILTAILKLGKKLSDDPLGFVASIKEIIKK